MHPLIKLIESLPINYKTYLWAANNFDQTYEAKWIPQTFPTLIFAGDKDHITPLKLFAEMDAFQRDNILIREIKDASHFPWLDNPYQVKQVFAEFCQKLT